MTKPKSNADDVKARTEAGEVPRMMKIKESFERTGKVPPDQETVIALLRASKK